MDIPQKMTDDAGTYCRPLVSFVVVAYNQEKFIREAVDGAFSQTYEPLEIILSDDCSNDRTFEIMNEMARAYDGPHNIQVVRNPRNLGTFDHAIALGKRAAGEIIVGAAGDDISEPERTTRAVDAFMSDPRVGAVFSPVAIIDEEGKTLSPHAERPLHLEKPQIYLRDRQAAVIQGCSAAYKRWVFDVPIGSTNRHFAEDLIFSLYLNLLGAKIVYLDAPLVKYRTHPAAASNYLSPDPVANELKAHELALARLEFLAEFEEIALKLNKSHLLDSGNLNKTRAFIGDHLAWPSLTFSERLVRTIASARSRGDRRASTKMMVWRLVRLWGTYPHYQPKTLLSKYRKT